MIIFIIPAYNEEKNIADLLSNLGNKMKELKHEYRVILVNDGSTDGTNDEALKFIKKISLDIVDHETNKGVGQVFRSGFSRAMEIAKDNDIIVTKEADNTSDLQILDTMLQKINGGHDLVLASCYAKEGKITGTTKMRFFLSYSANLLVRVLFFIKETRTCSSFYRVYRAGILRKALLAYDGRLIEDDEFSCMVEILIKLNRLGIKIAEVPMILKCDMRKGVSKMNKRKNIISYFCLIIKELLRSRKYVHGIVKKFNEL